MTRIAIYAIIVGIFGAYWSWRLLQWYLSANSLLYCILGSQCPVVFQTSFSYFYSVPIHVFAVIWFSALTVIAGLRAYGIRRASLIGFVIGALSVPAVIYLDYIELAVVNAFCWDCEIAHILGLFLFILFAAMYYSDKGKRNVAK